MSQGSADFDVRYVLRAVRRRLPIFLLCVALVPAAALVYSLLQKKQYTAQASILFRDPQFDQKLFGTSYVQNQPDPARVAATNLDLVSLPRVAALTAEHLHGITADQVSSSVSASSNGQSDLVLIQATASTPGFASQLANAYADQYITFRRNADRATIDSAEAPLNRQIAALPKQERLGALGQSLEQRLSQLSVLASLQTGGAELVQPAPVPKAPSSPKPVRNAVFGVFFGVLLGIALVVLAEALDRRLRDPSEVEEMFRRPLLALLPESSAFRNADAGVFSAAPRDLEAFRTLWVNLRYFGLSRDIRSVLVTSADRDDGKSSVASGLAVAAASAGTRTLLIEADLRKPTFAKRFKVGSRDGVTTVLAGEVPSSQAILRLPLPVGDGNPSPARSLDVLPAGPRPPDPTDLLQSNRMADFLRWVESKYDLVIIDTPPAAIVPDAVPLTSMVSGVIVVSRLGNTIRDHLRRLRQQLGHLEAPILGIVINSASGSDPYGYAYEFENESGPSLAAHSVNGARSRLQDEPAAQVTYPSEAGGST